MFDQKEDERLRQELKVIAISYVSSLLYLVIGLALTVTLGVIIGWFALLLSVCYFIGARTRYKRWILDVERFVVKSTSKEKNHLIA